MRRGRGRGKGSERDADIERVREREEREQATEAKRRDREGERRTQTLRNRERERDIERASTLLLASAARSVEGARGSVGGRRGGPTPRAARVLWGGPRTQNPTTGARRNRPVQTGPYPPPAPLPETQHLGGMGPGVWTRFCETVAKSERSDRPAPILGMPAETRVSEASPRAPGRVPGHIFLPPMHPASLHTAQTCWVDLDADPSKKMSVRASFFSRVHHPPERHSRSLCSAQTSQ